MNGGVDYKGQLILHFRRGYLTQDAGGYNIWRTETIPRTVPAAQTAIIICDMWDKHWARGAAERVADMAPYMNEVVGMARLRGVQIIHAPSETMDFYQDTFGRHRIRLAPDVLPPEDFERPSPPLPIDDADDGSDTGETEPRKVWTRQHPAIQIDQEVDVVSDDGREIYSFLHQEEIRQVLIMGVHTNRCILNRSFGIKQMVKWGVNIALVRDLTDAMYNPAMPPYVGHHEGTRLVVGYIEKFWCPTISSEDLTGESQ
jgi:nicotinamidase-related amidase